MTEPETGHERWREAERELGTHPREPIKPIEETDAVAEAVEDETPVTGLEELAARQADAAATEEQPEDDDADTGEKAEARARHGEETESTKHTTPERLAHQSEARQGEARQGEAQQGEARQGEAQQGEAGPT